ncbi:tail fiber domain-containing protein [Winogradskyella forsetii]|uniref:tail fiber domain-containing protein n=1 Tax=Winogradskyella forsetii TaxID=2686077 RepID=UPI0015B9B88D|nr:tail fiber domain-containing protein [Winogradskyella forsetii]
MKKEIITLVFALFIAISSYSQAIGVGINYKAVIKNSNGNVVSEQPISVRFSILDRTVPANIMYRETHNITTTSNGIIVLVIGEGTIESGLFYGLDWGVDLYLLQVDIDIENDGSYVSLDPQPFHKVPYASYAHAAYRAEVAETAYNVTGLEKITESGNTGWRLVDRNPTNYGSIGSGAIDLSYSDRNAAEERGATGLYSTAIGYNTRASEYNSVAIGNFANASDTSSIAIGSGASASGGGSIALGSYTLASGSSSTAMGDNTNASGTNSTAMGIKTTAQSYAEIAIGSYNTSYVPSNTSNWNEDDRLFVIGNGQSPSTTNNALTILKNGNTSVGGDNPESLLEVTHSNGAPISNLRNAFSIRNSDTNHSWQFYTATYLNLYKDGIFKGSWNSNSGAYVQASDRRVKKDITALENGTLNKVLKLNPVSYLMKDQTDTKRNLGLISQEVKDIFPSITHYVKDSDLLALSYTELIPVLIKALQEQQAIIEGQNKQIEALSIDNSLLKEKDVIQDKSIEALVGRLNLLESKSTH